MSLFRNALALREQRMIEGRRRARIESTRIQILNAALSSVAGQRLSYHQDVYLTYLCGYETTEPNALKPEEKAYVGNLFEQACRARRKVIKQHPHHERIEALPGLLAVLRNRELVRQRQSEASRRKRQLT